MDQFGAIIDVEDESPMQSDLLLLKIKEIVSEKEMELLELRFFENRSFYEIGFIMEISEANAKMKLYRAIAKIKNILSVGKHDKV